MTERVAAAGGSLDFEVWLEQPQAVATEPVSEADGVPLVEIE